MASVKKRIKPNLVLSHRKEVLMETRMMKRETKRQMLLPRRKRKPTQAPLFRF